MAKTNLHCPECDQIDSVRKVSSIVGDGTSSGTYSSYATGIGYSLHGFTVTKSTSTITGGSQTSLSQLLSPPAKPTERHFDLILLLTALPTIIGGIVTFLGVSDVFDNSSAAGWTLFFGILFLAMAVLLFLYYRECIKSERIQFEGDFQDWKNAVSKWQKLYYCYLCDGVFLPNLDQIIPSQHAYDYLCEDEEEE